MTGGERDRASLAVLVVDDDDDQRMLLRRAFARAGIEQVSEASDGDAAVTAAGDLQPDLIVLDLAMPARSGLDVLPSLRQVAPGAQVVVLSAFPRWRLAEVARRRGAVGYVEKRVRPDRVVGEVLVAAALAERAAQRMSTSFDRDLHAPAEARRFVRGVLDPDDEDVVGAVELLVSEMVTNAVVHATSAPTVDVYVDDDVVRVEVRDADPRPPRPRPADVGSPGGRGLLLLERMASAWGSDPHDGGKVVWFELERPPRSA